MDHGCTKVQEHVHSHFKPEKHVSHFPGGRYRLIAANSYLDNDAKRPARKDMDTAICSNRRGFGWSWAETCARRQMKLQPSAAMGKNVKILLNMILQSWKPHWPRNIHHTLW
jgi:hypothetical protein